MKTDIISFRPSEKASNYLKQCSERGTVNNLSMLINYIIEKEADGEDKEWQEKKVLKTE